MQSFLDLQYGFLEVAEKDEPEDFKTPEPKNKKLKKPETEDKCENQELNSDGKASNLLDRKSVV